MRRLLALVAVTTTAAALLAAWTVQASADEGANTCLSASDLGEWTSRSGSVTPADPKDWFGHSTQANQRTIRLRPTIDDADLEIWDAGCNTRLCISNAPGTVEDICTVAVTGRVNVRVQYFETLQSHGISNYTLTVELPPACRDGYDNDNDGVADYPLDTSCADPNGMSEGTDPPGPCTGSPVCVALTPGSEVLSVPVGVVSVVPPGARIAGYTDLYHFVVGGIEFNLPCVILVGGATTLDPCAQAGGVPVDPPVNRQTLVDQTVPTTPGGGSPIVTVRVCNASLTATVNNIGITSAPVYTLCP